MIRPVSCLFALAGLPFGGCSGESTILALGLIAVAVALYLYYARHKRIRDGATYHVSERLAQEPTTAPDKELRVLLKTKGFREEEPFEEIVARALVIDSDRERVFDDVVVEAAQLFSQRVSCSVESLVQAFLEGTRTGATPVTSGVALPHLRLPNLAAPEMVLVRCRNGVSITTTDVCRKASTTESTYAILFLVSPEENPGQHLRLLAQLASRVDEVGFLLSWLHAGGVHELKEALLRNERVLSLVVRRGSRAGGLADRALRDLALPQGCLVALIQRSGEVIIPHGTTVICEGDALTIIGDRQAIDLFRRLYTSADETGS